MYTPIDAGPIETEIIETMASVDRFVVYTHYAQEEIEKSLNRLWLKNPDFRFPTILTIPHGVDTSHFYPYPDEGSGQSSQSGKVIAKKELYGNEEEFVDSFIVLNGNRNQPRKRIDVTLKGFALFAARKPKNVKLYLHMGVEDLGWNLITLANRYGIDDRLILTSPSKNMPAVSIERLNLIYNACDVGINTSVGEGWGLVSFEHAATRAAQIIPNHSAGAELWQGSAEMLEPTISLTNPQTLTEEQIIAPEAVAAGLENLYENPDYLIEMSKKAYEQATKTDFRWDVLAKRWQSLFQEVLAEI